MFVTGDLNVAWGPSIVNMWGNMTLPCIGAYLLQVRASVHGARQRKPQGRRNGAPGRQIE